MAARGLGSRTGGIVLNAEPVWKDQAIEHRADSLRAQGRRCTSQQLIVMVEEYHQALWPRKYLYLGLSILAQ